MDLIPARDLSKANGWRPPTSWRDRLDPPVRLGRDERRGRMLDVREVRGIPDNVAYVIAGVGEDEILPGETSTEAMVRLGRAVRLDLSGDLDID